MIGLLLKPHAFAAANSKGARPMAETDRHLRKLYMILVYRQDYQVASEHSFVG